MKRGKFERTEPKQQKKVNAGLLQTYVFSVLSLVLCCAMFLSTTFAWFTAEVENQGNEVYVGKLAVDLLDSVGNSLQDAEPVFDGNIKWEPGATEYRTLHIVNTGDLSFNYRLLLTGGQGDRNIAKSISVYAIDGAVIPASRDEIANTWAYIGSLADVLDSALPLCKGEYDVPADLFIKNGEIRQNVASVTIALRMDPEVSDPSIMGKSLTDIGIKLMAFQKSYESDAFGSDYDIKDPAVDSVKVYAGQVAKLQTNVAPSAVNKLTTIELPQGAFDGKTVSVEVGTTNSLFNINALGATVASLDVKLSVNGIPFTGELTSGKFRVSTYIPTGLELTTNGVDYAGTDGRTEPDLVSYDPISGLLVFETTHFSSYDINGMGLAFDPVEDAVITDVLELVQTLKQTDSKVVIPAVNTVAVKDAISAAQESGALSEEAAQAAVEAVQPVVGYETLADALAATDTVTLQNNVLLDVDNTITIPADRDIILDLNGKTITGISDGTGSNRVMFDVRGKLTVKNGEITTQHAGTNMGWGHCSEIFYVAFNGSLNVENATLKNLGGTDMAYCVDLVNSTGVTFTAENAVMDSAYIPFRVFNNGSGMNTVTIKDSKLHGGNRAFWVHIYTAADNNGQLKDQTLALNIFNNGNTFAADKAAHAPICYGFTDAYWYTPENSLAYVYAETADGLAAALANGYNVRLYNDISVTDVTLTVPAGKQVKLDTNGKKLSGKSTVSDTSNLIKVSAGASLELVGNGKITFFATSPDLDWGEGSEHPYPGYANNTIRCEGKLIVNGPVLENTTASGGASYVIDCYTGADLVVKDGLVNGYDKTAIRMFCGNNIQVTVEGGEVRGYRAVWLQLAGSDAKTAPAVSLNVHGGELTATDDVYKDVIYTYSYGNSFDNVVINISGGVFNGDVAFCGGKKIGTQKETITGGFFNGELGRYTDSGWVDIAKPAQ